MIRRLLIACMVLGLPALASAQPIGAGVFSRIVFEGGCQIRTGSGSPEGAVSGNVCDVFLRTDGTAGGTLYVKESGGGTTGWTALGAGGGGGAHNLLSATHPDTLANAPLRGAILTGQGASPAWGRLALGGSGTFLRSNGVDAIWSSDGSSLTTLNAANLTTGTVAPARLGSGTPDSSTFLRGDSTWTASTVAGHAFLSADHTDTTPASPTRGDLITSQGGTAEWTRLPVGDANSVLASDGTDPAWSATPQLTRLGIGRAPDGTAPLAMDGQYWSDEFDAGNSGTSLTIDWNDGNQQYVVLTGNVTLTFSNAHPGGRYMLILEQDATGSRTVTWPATVRWIDGTAPTLSTDADAIDLCTFASTAAASGVFLAACNVGYAP